MDKQLLPSIEKFAAYLDGNLSQDEMLQFSHLATNNEELMNLIDANATVEETLASYDDADLHIPEEFAGWDFKLPEIENVTVLDGVTDSSLKNGALYQQEDLQVVEKILDDVFDDKVLETEDIDDFEIDFDTDIWDTFN